MRLFIWHGTMQQCVSIRRWVAELEAGAVWVALSSTLRGRLHALEASGDPAVLRALPAHFPVGRPLRCRILRVRL